MASIIVTIVVVALILALVPYVIAVGILTGIIYGAYRLILYIRKEKYFRSNEFLVHKEKVDSMVYEYNEIAEYVKDIPNSNKFVPKQDKYKHADLATYENTSKHNYKRDRNTRDLDNINVYQASLQIVKRASEEPIKYLCKYFNIDQTEENLNQLEAIGENISRMENTIENLELRQEQIKNDFKPPKFILKHYYDQLMEKIGVRVSMIKPEYTEYVFEYVSPGGNSSQNTTITFNGRTVETIAEYISEKIKYRDSAEGQRALMTKSYREKIKSRDNYTCQMCSASIYEQNLLLLEVDHIIPVSKGGKSVDENLQTLCWKCNRTKGNKIID